jgi:hypothetical protein
MAFGDFPAVHVDVRALGMPAQTTAFALARWEGPGVLLTTRSSRPLNPCDVGPGPRRRALQRSRACLCSMRSSIKVMGGDGQVTSFWWVPFGAFAMTDLPVATDLAQWAWS